MYPYGASQHASIFLNLGPSFYFMTKKEATSCHFFSIKDSTFHKTKTRTYIIVLRQAPLLLDLRNACLKSERSICNID